MQLLCDKYTYIIYMYTMVSPTSQSENPKSCRGPIERTIVDSRERASPQPSSPPSPWKIGCDFDSKSFDLRGRKREGKKERERQGGRTERERERRTLSRSFVNTWIGARLLPHSPTSTPEIPEKNTRSRNIPRNTTNFLTTHREYPKYPRKYKRRI